VNIYGPPTCSKLAFLIHLDMEQSSARPEAEAIWDMLVTKGIDPAVGLGFFHHESTCGKLGRARITKSWGNLRWREVYADLVYPVRNVDGFAAYESYVDAARHFAEHLLGADGTNSYAGLKTVEQVVPIWAPAADHNVPTAYIAAVNELATMLGGQSMAKPRILHVAGHLRCQNITEEGLCDYLDKAASAAALRGMTGTSGEQQFTADMATRQMNMMVATGKLEARAVDSAYSSADYLDWKPSLVIAHHIHRDGQNRAMFAVPDSSRHFKYHSDAASAESERLLARIIGGYAQWTGIPVQQDLVTLRMRQLYTWCYIDESSQALIAEYGNGNVDNVVLFGQADLLARFMTAAVLEHFNLAQPPTPPPPSPDQRSLADIATDLESLAKELRDVR
jgi:hypothetical protein